jgi:hypothetical protein
MITAPSALAQAIVTSLSTPGGVPYPRDRWAECIEEQLAPVRAALRDLALAAAHCAQHRAYHNETLPLPPLSYPGDTPDIKRIDDGPTEDAARCQTAIDKARPVLESFGLNLRQPPPHQS